jgi:hypothetical protein
MPRTPQLQTVSLDALGDRAADPQSAGTVRLHINLAEATARAQVDPFWAPSPDEVPIVGTDVDTVFDVLEEHYGSVECDARALLLLAERIARRNSNIVSTVLHTFRSNGTSLAEFLQAANDAIAAWAGKDVAQADAYLGILVRTARLAGLTPAQACAFGQLPVDLVVRITEGQTPGVYQALVDDGASSYREIARRIGISRETVRRVAASWGDPNFDRRHRTDLHERVRALHADGLSYRRIALAAGCSIGLVAKVLSGPAAS